MLMLNRRQAGRFSHRVEARVVRRMLQIVKVLQRPRAEAEEAHEQQNGREAFQQH